MVMVRNHINFRNGMRDFVLVIEFARELGFDINGMKFEDLEALTLEIRGLIQEAEENKIESNKNSFNL